MKIIVASPTGMCFGVKRALQLAEQAASGNGYALGPVVHNRQVMDWLTKRGLRVGTEQEIPDSATVLVRAHGAGPEVFHLAEEKGWHVIDATCPYVRVLQHEAKTALLLGHEVVLVGDSDHPEVKAVQSHCQGRLIVVPEALYLPEFLTKSKVVVLAQTTTPPHSWQEVIQYIREQGKEVVPIDTICAATQERQQAVYDLSAKVDIMVIVGGNNSANTRNLARVSKSRGIPTRQVETPDQLQPEWFVDYATAGIAAGASTPDWIIEEVVVAMENIKPKEEEVVVVAEEEAKQECAEEVAEKCCCDGECPEEPTTEEAATEEVATEEAATEEAATEEQEEQIEAMPAQDAGVPSLKRGQSVQGKVVSLDEEGMYVNIGQKSDAYIVKNELSNDPAAVISEMYSIGDELEAVVIRIDTKEDKIFLSRRRAIEEQGMKSIIQARDAEKILQGKVLEAVKGGVMVELMGVRAFMPASHVDLRYVPDLSAYVGQTVSVVIKEIEEGRRRVVVSRKEALERKTEEIKDKMWDTLTEGELRDGVVQRLTDFGAFVDLGGLDGLVHVSEISWARVNHPSEVLAEGQNVQVKVLGLDQERGRISLSLKQAEGDPWTKVSKQFSAGQVVDGKVVRTASFGAFVEITPGIEGLVHISQLSYDRVERTEDAVNPGDEVKVKILSINPDEHRVSLSIKETMDRPPMRERDDFRPERSERRGGGRDSRAQNYREESKVTLGDMFGDLLKDKKEEN